MSFYAAIFSALIGAIKIGIMVFGRMIIVTDQILKCNVDKDQLYFNDEMGLYYFALFALQLLLGGEHMRVAVYEGAI